MSGRATYSPLTILAAIKAHKDGRSANSVAKAYKVSPSTIIRWRLNWGHEVDVVEPALSNLASRAS